MTTPVFQVAGRYQVGPLLGRGATGAVFRVLDKSDGSARALKVLHSAGTAEPAALFRAFHSEFLTLTRLRHPHLVRVHDFGISQIPRSLFGPESGQVEAPWFTMDLVAGKALDLALRPPFDWALVARVADAVLDALGEIHAHGLIHADVTAANILVGEPAHADPPPVRLMDLGLAIRTGGADPETIRGTPATLAPENLRGQTVDGRSDLYSLGCVLYRVTTGQDPFRGDSPWEIIRQHLATPPLPPRHLNPDLPASLEEVILQLMAKNPAQRPPTALAVRHLLAPLSGRSPARGTPLREALGPVLAGREREMALFDEALAQLSRGRGETWLLRGPSGMGRTRLLEEFCLASRMAGLRAALVRGQETPRRPGGLFDALLVQLGVAARNAARSTPRLEDLLRAVPAQPAVVLIDDAEEADPASLDQLAALASLIRQQEVPVLLVAALETGDGDGQVTGWGATLAEQGLVRALVLRPLDREGVGTMAASMLGTAGLPPAWPRALESRTGGWPLLVEELVRSLAAAGRAGPGAPVPEDPEATLAGLTVTSPRSREWFEARWKEMSPGEKATTGALAISGGEPLSFDDLERLDPHAGLEPQTLDSLVSSGIVRRLRDASGMVGLALASPALAPLILERTPRGTLETLHLRRAEILAGQPGREAVRARHLLAGGEPAPALDLLTLAAERGLSEGLPGEACRLADEALALAAGLGQSVREAPLRRLRAAGLAAAGHVREADDEFRRAVHAARRGEDARELALALRAAGTFRGERGDPENALANLEEALALLDELADLGGGARVLLEFGRLQELLGRPEEAETRLVSALNQARRAELPDVEAEALLALGELCARRGRHEQAGGHFRAAQVAAGQAAAPHTRSAARRGKILSLLATGRPGEALAESRQFLEETRQAENLPAEAEALALGGRILAALGRRQEACKALEESLAARRRLGQDAAAAELQGMLAEGLLERGLTRAALLQAQEAEDAARRAMVAPARHAAARARARIAAWLGQPGLVEELFPKDAQYAAAPHFAALRGLLLGEARLRAGAPEPARGLLQEACFVARRAGMPEMEAASFLLLAEAYLDLHEDERAVLALRRVRQTIEEGPYPELVAVAQVLSAERELARPEGDALAAAEQAGRARQTLAERERGDWLWRAAHALARAADRSGQAEIARSAGDEARRRLDAWLEGLPETERSRVRTWPRVRALLDRPPPEAAPEQPAPAGDGAALQRLLDINRALNSTLELRPLLKTLLDTAIELSGAERGFVLLEGGERATVELARGEGGADLAGPDRELSRGVALTVMQEGKPLLSVDARSDARLAASGSIHALRIQSILACPLTVRGRIAGAIVVDSRRAAGMFEPRHQEWLAALAEQAGIALGNARLVEELRRQAEEIRRLNDKLSQQVEEQRIEILEKQSNLEVRFRYDCLIGASPAMQKLYRALDKIVPTTIPVLLTGDSGTGKDVIARVLHYNGPRREQRFVTVNCAALTDTLLESELFGHKRGAFTGADRDRKGLFEQADQGTLFLDEIGEMPLPLQPKLLRAIQFGEVRRVGEDAARQVDVRIIAATNRDLGQAVREGRFREDLLYRLDVARLHLVPLAERLEDIGLLVEHFLAEEAEKSRRPPQRIEPAALRLFLRHRWPGNVRELQNEVTKLSAFTSAEVITELDVLENATFLERAGRSAAAAEEATAAGLATLEQTEVEQIRQALRTARGNRRRAAEILGIDRSTLYRKLKRLGELDGNS